MKTKRLFVLGFAAIACAIVATVYRFASSWVGGARDARVEYPPPSPVTNDPIIVGIDASESSRLPAIESPPPAEAPEPGLEDLVLPRQPDETSKAYQERINQFEVKVATFRKEVATLDQYPAYYHVKPVVNMCAFLQEYLNGRAFPMISGVSTKDSLPVELRETFDDFHVYSDALGKNYCFVFTAEQYPLVFELLSLKERGLGVETRLDDDLMMRVKALADQTLAMLP